jgi:hypothetical protein
MFIWYVVSGLNFSSDQNARRRGARAMLGRSGRVNSVNSFGKAIVRLFALALFVTGGVAMTVYSAAAPVPPLPPPPGSATDGPIPNETYLWRPVAIGGGGFITGMSSDATGITRVVRTDVHGAYSWNETAGRWAQLATATAMPASDRVQSGMNEGAYEVVVAPGDPKRLYMAIKGRVFRSDDSGHSWGMRSTYAPFPHPFDANSEFRLYGPFMAVSPDDANLVLIGTAQDGLWRSTDGAATWSQVASVPAGADLRPEAGVQSPGVTIWFGPSNSAGQRTPAYAASAGHGVFFAKDAAGSFAPLVATGSQQPVTVAQTSFGADGTLFAVDTEARKAWAFKQGEWTDFTSKGGLPAAQFSGVAADPVSRRVFVSDQSGQIWCSATGSGHWSPLHHEAIVGSGDPPWLRVNNESYFASGQIQFDKKKANRLWVAAGTGPYYADVGEICPSIKWTSQVRGIEELVANDVVQPIGHAPLFAAWDFGIHVKPDLNAFSTTYGPKERVIIAAQQLDWSAGNPNFIVTNASDTRTGCCSGDGDAVLAGYSVDAGNSWHKFATLPQPPGTKADDPWRMSFGTIAVAADNIDNIVWAPAFNRSPFYTLDRGATWQRVVFDGEKLPFTGSFGRFIGTRKTVTADRVAPGTFYLVHSGEGENSALSGLWRTTNGGRLWSRVFSGEIAPGSDKFPKLRAVPRQVGNLFFTTSASYGADTRLRRSYDGGQSWAVLDAVDRVDDVAFGKSAPGASYPTIFISGRVSGKYGVWRSTDDAQSWQRLAKFPLGRLDQVTVIEADKNVFGRVYLGYQGSGWIYGQPTPCKPAVFRQGEDRECTDQR